MSNDPEDAAGDGIRTKVLNGNLSRSVKTPLKPNERDPEINVRNV